MTKFNAFTREDLKFWLTIITMVVSITVWGMTLSNKIDLVAQKLDNHMDITEKTLIQHDTSLANLRTSLAEVWRNIVTLNTLHNR